MKSKKLTIYKHKATEGPGDSNWACAWGEYMESYKAAPPPHTLPLYWQLGVQI